MEQKNIRIQGIAGTSMGAVVGGMYLACGSLDAARQRWVDAQERGLIPEIPKIDVGGRAQRADNALFRLANRIRDRIVISVAANRATVVDEDEFEQALEYLIPEVDIQDLPMPFIAVATDLATGEEVRIADGPLRFAVQASASIPAMVPAVEWRGRHLVDGGVVAEVPVSAAKTIGHPVIAVDVGMELPDYHPDDLVIHTLVRAQLLTSRLLRAAQVRAADVALRPRVGATSWADWERSEEFEEAGRRAALAAVRDGRI